MGLNPLSKEIGFQIRIARERAGIKQNRLSQMLGKTKGWLSLVERGIISPTYLDVFRIAHLLGYDSPADFINLPPELLTTRDAEPQELRLKYEDVAKIAHLMGYRSPTDMIQLPPEMYRKEASEGNV